MVEPAPVKKEEVQDPRQMDIDEEEIDYEPDKLNLEVRNFVLRGLAYRNVK